MHSDAMLTGLLAEHCRRMNTGDVDAMLEIYSPSVRFEDPVGARTMVGHDELRGHFTRAAESQTYDIPGTPVAAGDGRHAMLPVSVQMNYLPLGPALVLKDEIPNPNALKIKTILNGQAMQDWTTEDMIFDVRTLIAFLSGSTTLLPGSVIMTGTPHGVGAARKPPVFLKAGDTVTIEIEKIGQLTNPVIDEV